MPDISKKLVSIVVALILVSAILPVGISNVINANTTGWDATSLVVWSLIPVMTIIGVVLLILKLVGVL